MAYKFLQKIFGKTKEGEEPKAMTIEEIEKALDEAKDIQIVDNSDGRYVEKKLYDDKEAELKTVQGQLTAANEQIKSFEGQDVEGIKTKVSEWEAKYNTDTQALKDQMAKRDREYAEDLFMSGYNFTSKAARAGILAEIKSKEFPIENKVLLGGKEYMQSLMENDDYKAAFKSEEPASEPDPIGKPPMFSKGSGGDPEPKKSLFDFGFNHIREPKEK